MPVFVIQPPEKDADCKPYRLQDLARSYEVLPTGEVLRERDLQAKIDTVFPSIDLLNIEERSVFKQDGKWRIDFLTHRNKPILFDLLEIDSIACIVEDDEVAYRDADYETRMGMEIPARFNYGYRKLRQLQLGNSPFIVPNCAYSNDLGLDASLVKPEYYSKFEFL